MMSEQSPSKEDGCLVQVKAQVMTRDDSSGGWVPVGGGGMSSVGLQKVFLPNHGKGELQPEYHICGEKIADKSVVLNCVIKKDVQYTKANPTFHHWRTEEKRYGLTFQTSSDARAFDKAVKRTIDNLMEGIETVPIDLDVGEDDVFMKFELPLSRKESSSQSVSTVSTTTSSPTAQSPVTVQQNPHSPAQHPSHQHLHRVHYISASSAQQQPLLPQTQVSTKTFPALDRLSPINIQTDDMWLRGDLEMHPHIQPDPASSPPEDSLASMAIDSSYVQFDRTMPVKHEYSYPTIETISNVSKSPHHMRRDSISSLKKHNLEMLSKQPPLPTKCKRKKKTKKDKKSSRHLLTKSGRCVYCHEMFSSDVNPRGSCEEAPDKVANAIENVSCICCVKGILYHCVSDVEGDYGHPCICDKADDSNCKKWTALTFLSLFVPCLWCYWPLTACHRCGVSAGCCGGQHKAA